MAKNLVYRGDTPALSLPVPSGIRSGHPVKVGGIVGVAETDRAGDVVSGKTLGGVSHPTGYAAVSIDGTYALAVPEAVASAGTPIYITAANALTTDDDDGANALFGHTVPVVQRGVPEGATKASGEGTVNVKIVRI